MAESVLASGDQSVVRAVIQQLPYTFFASVLNSKTGCCLSIQLLVLEDGDGEQKRLCIIHNKTFLDLLQKLDSHMSMGPDGVHSRARRVLVGVVAKPHSIIIQQSWITRTGDRKM